jgi:hypothetical protein
MLFILSLMLAGVSLIVLIVGGVLTLVFYGQTRHRSGPEVGAEIMSDHIDSEAEGRVVAQRSFFVGRAVSVERQATIDFAELKQQLAAGNWSLMIPALLAIGGFVGLLFFGALAALFGIPNIWIGGAVALLVLYVLVRMGIAFIRA